MGKTNSELTNTRFFTKFKENSYPHLLNAYKNADDFYPAAAFEKLTGGEGNTEAFRECLREYIKDFKVETLIPGKPYQLKLNNDGKFIVINKETKEEVKNLSNSEKTIYHYMCFIHTARFWQEFEKMRDMHAQPKPLVIMDLVENLDESVNVDRLIKKAKGLNRKVVLVI